MLTINNSIFNSPNLFHSHFLLMNEKNKSHLHIPIRFDHRFFPPPPHTQHNTNTPESNCSTPAEHLPPTRRNPLTRTHTCPKQKKSSRALFFISASFSRTPPAAADCFVFFPTKGSSRAAHEKKVREGESEKAANERAGERVTSHSLALSANNYFIRTFFFFTEIWLF